MVVIGYVIILIGVVLIVIGAVGSAFAVAETRPKGFAAPSTTIGSVLKALPEIIAAIAKSPPWLASIIIGCVLVWFGDQARTGGWPFV
jgi:uncharacterized membrane protein